MNQELLKDLVKAQLEDDRILEGRLIKKLYSFKDFKTNDMDGKSAFQRFHEKIVWTTCDCWFWIGCTDKIGYGRSNYAGENKAHRISWLLHKGNIPEGMKVLHKCDVRNCVNPGHLFLGTQAENVSDMDKKGRRKVTPKRGEENPMARLSLESVKKIRNLYSKGNISQHKLAEKFSVSPMTVNRIINKKTWI